MRVRVSADAQLCSPGLNADPHFAELIVEDGSGVVLTTPTAAAIAASPMAVGQTFGSTATLLTGLLTVTRPGLYRVSACLSNLVHSAAATLTVALQKNSAALSPVVQSVQALAGTVDGVINLQAILPLQPGDTLRLVATASAGNFTVKSLRFDVVQLSDVVVSPTT